MGCGARHVLARMMERQLGSGSHRRAADQPNDGMLHVTAECEAVPLPGSHFCANALQLNQHAL